MLRGKKFAKEFKKTLSTAIATAAGLITAFAWRDVLTESLGKVSALSPIQGQIVNAIIVTVIAVIVIMFTTKLHEEK